MAVSGSAPESGGNDEFSIDDHPAGAGTGTAGTPGSAVSGEPGDDTGTRHLPDAAEDESGAGQRDGSESDGGTSARPAGDLVARPPAELVAVRDTRPGWAGPVRTTTGVARVALSAVGEVTSWGIDTALGVTTTVVRGSMAGHPPNQVLSRAGDQVRESVRRALGIDPLSATRPAAGAPGLREHGAELLRRSASMHEPDNAADDHPAFARILADLAPDEARILRFLYLDGPQPALDIRTGRTLGSGTQRVEAGMALLGAAAALRSTDRALTYLINLRRLGLITDRGDQLGNPGRYQLLESQPEVRRLLKRGLGTKVGYRSIALTPFGTDFTYACLPVPPPGRAL